MGFIEDFLARYTKEYDFYEQAGRLAAQKLEAEVLAAGVRAIVTHRAKSITRLTEKVHQRDTKRGGYKSVDEIFDDIVDLAGVRVALYFPAERVQVESIVNRLFLVRLKKEFPEPNAEQPGKRFRGYFAEHYRIQLREQDLSDLDARYAAARIEVQVASVIMHAWAEVNHDLLYKPREGELSDQERALLDQLNGLVMTGEISLEQLQRAREVRVAEKDRKIANHYDLATYLLSRAAKLTDKPIGDSGLGRVDILFDFIAELGLNTPGGLEPHLEAIHENFELRPLAEQIVDSLLTEDASRYDVYSAVRARRRTISPETEPGEEDVYRQIGMFLAAWTKLERLLRGILQPTRPTVPNSRQLVMAGLLDEQMGGEFELLRQTRNLVVHGVETPSAAYLDEATQRIGVITTEVELRWAALQGQDGE